MNIRPAEMLDTVFETVLKVPICREPPAVRQSFRQRDDPPVRRAQRRHGVIEISDTGSGFDAVAIVARTDALNFQGYALTDLAEVPRAAGRLREAAAALEQALERYEPKQNLAMAAQVRPKLAALRDETA